MQKIPDNLKALRGTAQPCRETEQVVAEIAGEPRKPAGLEPGESLIWDRKIRDMELRGVSIRGCEDMFRLYVGVLFDIEETRRKGKQAVAAATLAQARAFSAMFFDDPAAQRVTKAGKPTSNPFAQHGKRGAA